MKSTLPGKPIYYFLLFIFFYTIPLFAGIPRWYNAYKEGLDAVEAGNWQKGVSLFQEALQVKHQDSNKTRAFGTIFIEYYAHRELGICYFHLGDIENARKELSLSLRQSYSDRAKVYLERINQGQVPARKQSPAEETATTTPEVKSPMSEPETTEAPATSAEIVGDRLSIAVLPFDTKGLGNELGQVDLLDKMITGFVNINRFKVIERALLEKILEEQKLGMSGVIDASTAAQIGKGIGVDAVVVGSVTLTRTALSIDARLIDTESATIITARDAYSSQISLQSISQMINELALKIKDDLPLVSGYVISVDGTKLTTDLGRSSGVKKGMKCNVYREGSPIIHPVTGKVIAREIDELCEVQLTDVFDAYSTGIIIKTKNGSPQIRDKIVTK
jgi:TolB-like protein